MPPVVGVDVEPESTPRQDELRSGPAAARFVSSAGQHMTIHGRSARPRCATSRYHVGHLLLVGETNLINPIAWGLAWIFGWPFAAMGVEDTVAAWALGWIALTIVMFFVVSESWWVSGGEFPNVYGTSWVTGC
jgi:hypothetical protein